MSRSRGGGAFWPSPTQRALLEVALGPADEAAARWQALQPLDVTKLETGSFGLLPLLYERLRDVAPNDPQLPRLFGTYRSVWYRNQLLLDRLAVLAPLLRQRAPVRPLLVGGMSTLLRWYPRLGLRPVPQLELIVEREAASETVKVSSYAGWRTAVTSRTSTTLRDDAGRVLVIHRGAPAALVGPLWESGLAPLRERAYELESVDGAPLLLDPADEILFTCAIGARTVPVQTCQWLIDVDRILQSPDAPATDMLVERARRVHLLGPVRATLRYLAELDDGVPAAYVAGFDAAPLSRRDAIAFSLVGVRGRRLAGTAQVLASGLQATADDSALHAAARLPRYLQERWGAKSLAGVPMIALWKALRVLLPQTGRSAPDQNRPASS